MDNKYKALSYVPPKSINIKQRFGKLTLAACASAEKAKPSIPPSTSATARKALYTYKNPNNNDVRISDDSLLTDDESDEDGSPSGSERNKIINNILNSDDKSDGVDEIENLPNDQRILRYGNEMSQFSEKLLLDDSDETNCNAIEMEMGKLEISLNPPTPLGRKSSTPLFSTNSDTIVSRLSSQLDRLELNRPKLIKSATPLKESPDISVTNVSILTISSTIISDDSETEENTDEDEDADSDVIILSSDEDANDDDRGSSESEIEKHVSTISPSASDTLNTQVKQKLSDFFNNIPSPKTPERYNSIIEQEILPETPEGPEFIPETPENLSLNDKANPEPEPIINTDSSVAKINSQVAMDPNPNTSKETAEDTHVSINISTKIQINIQISDLEKTRCEATEPNEQKHDESDIVPHQDNSSPISDKTNSLVEKAPSVSEPNTNKFVGLNQTDLEIDEEMEGILNELYGTSWQTPQLLEKCLSTKKQAHCKPMQRKITEQIDDTDFSLFGKKINDELESTRLPEKNEEDKPQHLAIRRLDFDQVRRPRRQAALKTEKLLLKVCDPDTSDSDSNSSCQNGSDSDLNFTVNVNQIDDDSDDDEKEKENRRDHRVKKVLDRCEYTKKPSIKETTALSYQLPVTTPKLGNSKRKLFTPQNWINEIVLPDETPPSKPNASSCEEELKHISDWLAIQNKKLEQVKKHDLFTIPDGAASKTKNRVTPKSSAKKKPQPNASVIPKSAKTKQTANGTTYGFIQSLDEKISLEYCDREAIKYRENYNKTKVELAGKLYNLYNEKIFNFPEKLDLTWNKKLLTTAGRCLTKRKNGVRTCRVELSEKVVTTADRLRCTLVHELCHAANWLFDGENGHGQRWKAWASKSMKMFPELPKIDVRHNYDIAFKYVYMCLQCNAKQPAHSKSIKVDTKCCKFCHGKIQVFLNKKTPDGEIVPTPVREATGFAKFVQENYKTYKTAKLKHGEVMKVLGNAFRELARIE